MTKRALLFFLVGACWIPVAAVAQDLLDTSMVQLLSNPQYFHQKRVRVSGFLHQQFEDSCLYLSKEDADYLNGRQGLWIRFGDRVTKQPDQPVPRFDSKRVLIEGIFNKDEHGHMGAAAGAIERVSRIMEERQWFDGAKKLDNN